MPEDCLCGCETDGCESTCLERALYLTTERLRRLEVALTPGLWSRELSDAWHRNIPDTEAAFKALREIAENAGE